LKLIDYALAGILFVVGIVSIVMIEIRHPAGAVLNTPLLWILVAMFNLLRLRNGYEVEGLKAFCIAANLIALIVEVVRFKMFGPLILIQAVPILGETIFSVAGNNDVTYS
jgi:hypothetical protein